MVNFQIDSQLIFLLIIACHAILSVEGRHLKPLKQETQAKHTLNALQKPLTIANSFQVSPAGGTPTAFRPTMPGNSPGAGHSFTQHGLDSNSEAVESGNAFKPTKPGNSPGAGHSIHIQSTKPKA
ncbi:hypothetical protein L1987_18070 [Smallanthus sonchifolius]|uniref:Uncharacterized protein n=1 Tax=Smallanthus sonchifolius TaxID=185202 RepID=A0ACB9IZJ9_9ASTR|nr:hypothetical protein L1987_18070 [Smallanthus sonchifolius]